MIRIRLVSVFALVACGTTVYAQSLADVARKEEERRKAIATPGKVYTDADLKKFRAFLAPSDAVVIPTAPPAGEGVPPGSEQPPAQPEATTPGGVSGRPGEAATEGVAPGEPERDQAYWRQQFAEARGKLETARTMLQALTTQYDVLALAMTEDPAERARVDRERERVGAEIERFRSEVNKLAAALAALEADARRSNVPPGWIR